MANTLGGQFLAKIADQAIDYLGSEFFPVNLFTTNFSKDIAEKGESVTTRIVSSVTPSDLSNGHTPSDVTTTPVKITLSEFKGHVEQFSDLEMTKAGDPEWLMEHFLEPAKEATVKSFVDDLLALVVSANFSNATVKTASQFDADVMADIGGVLTKRRVPKGRRAMLVDPDYYSSIAKDMSVEDKSAFGDDQAIKERLVPRVRGFELHEYEAIPGNSQNLKGIALHDSALAIAVRPVFRPEVKYLAVENRIEPKTGLPFQFRTWYNPDAGKFRVSCGFLYGVQKGNPDALQRITSA